MASISGATSSNTVSSLYNSANMISGLASGLDTEGMIENLVKSYQTKISSLSQQATKTEWKQEAYRSIISKMVGFTNKYTSYSSATNLLSPSFFNNAVKVATLGLNKDKVTASGKTSSDIALNAVHNLATAAQFRVSDAALTGRTGDENIIKGTGLDLFNDTTLGALSGSMTVVYGSQKLNINFDEVADVKAMEDIRAKLTKEGKSATDADVLAGLINQKLEGQKITFSNGQSENAQDRVKAEVVGDSIVFKDLKEGAGNAVYISQASGNVAEKLGLDLDKASEEKNIKSFSLDGLKGTDDKIKLTREEDTAEYLSGKAMTLTLDGTTKTIYMPTIEKIAGEDGADDKYKINGKEVAKDDLNTAYTEALRSSVEGAFGQKITVDGSTGDGGKLNLSFTAAKGSDLKITSDVGKALGIGQTATTYLNTSKTLEDLFGTDEDGKLKINNVEPDSEGLYAFKINGKTIGKYSKDAKLSDILNDINSNKEAGVKVSYSQTTKEFLFSAKETGADSGIKIEAGGLAAAMFGEVDDTTAGYTKGEDAEFTATINGKQMTMTRSSNSVNIDGLTINMKEEFEGTAELDKNGNVKKDANGNTIYKTDENSVTFKSSTDSDKIVDAAKSMIEDYNAMLSEIRGAYSTLPAQKTDGSSYEPLTSDQASNYSTSEQEKYEEKAKQGILFADRDLSSLYDKLRNVFSPAGQDGAILRGMGISTSYDVGTGALTITLDEDKLRSMLDSDPDMVADAFTKTSGTGGVMQNLKTTLDTYAKTSGEPKGILIQKAGSPLSPLSLMNNTWQKQIDNLNTQIEKWQDKLSSQVDRYTQQFSRLEQLIAQMNSQSSALAGMMGGGSY